MRWRTAARWRPRGGRVLVILIRAEHFSEVPLSGALVYRAMRWSGGGSRRHRGRMLADLVVVVVVVAVDLHGLYHRQLWKRCRLAKPW